VNYLETYNLRYQSQTLRPRVAVACVRAAQDILNESPATTDHAKRVAWANSSMSNADGMADRMMWGLIGNSTIQSLGDAATDNDIQFVVNSLIGIYMGGV